MHLSSFGDGFSIQLGELSQPSLGKRGEKDLIAENGGKYRFWGREKKDAHSTGDKHSLPR